MAVAAKITHKGIEVESAYICLQSFRMQKQYHDEVKNYAVFCELFIFSSDSKKFLLETDTIFFLINDPIELTIEFLWSEIKKKYNGIDIID